MTEYKRFNVFDVDGTIFLEDHKEGSYHIGEIGNVDVNCLNDIADRLNELAEENEPLKQFKEKVFTLIEEELEEHPYLTLTEKWNPNCKNYHSCRGNHEKNVFYASRHTLLEKLKEELSYD